MQDNEKARLFSVALTLAVPAALLAGRWADRRDRPFLPLVIGASVSAMGLVGMALAGDAGMAKASYLIFGIARSEEHTSELQSLMRISYAVFCLKKKKKQRHKQSEVSEYNK